MKNEEYTIYEQEENIRSFLKNNKDKNNIHYLILNTIPFSFVDIRSLALKISNTDEKLKSLKQTMPRTDLQEIEQKVNFLIKSGNKVIETSQGFFDYFDALSFIIKKDFDFLYEKLENYEKKKIFALQPSDSIAFTRKLFTEEKIGHLPIIDDLKLSGEVRLCDLLTQDLFDTQKISKFDQRQTEPTINNEVLAIANTKPLTLDYQNTIKDLIEIMIKKRVSSVLVLKNEELFSVISYKDIFKKYMELEEKVDFSLEFVGLKDLYEDEKNLVEQYSEKTMEKIATISKYDNLKLTLKLIGQDSGHQKKPKLIFYYLMEIIF